MELNSQNLYNYFIEQNKSRKECALYFGCSEALISKRLHLYGIKKDKTKVMDILTNTMLKKYGVKNASHLDTNNFKVNNPSKDRIKKDKSIETFKRRYNSQIREKRETTNLKKYGAKTYAESEQFKQDVLKKNPNYNIISNKDELEKTILSMENPTYSNLCNLLGYSYSPIFQAIKKYDLGHLIKKEYSKTNIYWHDLILRETGFDFKYEGNIFNNPYEHSDLYLEGNHLAIDINPTITHNTQFNPFHPKNISSIDGKYHFRRAVESEKNGWLLYQIFDWDDESKIIMQLKNLLGINEKIYARKCEVKEISKNDKSTFLNKYHLQGDINSKYNYGLYYNGNLVAVMTFGKARFTKIAEYELLRFCSKNSIVGGASKLFKYFIKEMNPISIMTYSDMAKGHGNVYSKLGFEFHSYASLNALYAPINIKGVALKTQTASKEYSKHKDEFASCQEYFNSKRWYRINDAGNKIWLWKNSSYNSENQEG